MGSLTFSVRKGKYNGNVITSLTSLSIFVTSLCVCVCICIVITDIDSFKGFRKSLIELLCVFQDPVPLEECPLNFINTEEELADLVKILKNEKEIAVDLEVSKKI